MSTTTRRKERHRAMPLLPEIRSFAAQNLEIREADSSGDKVYVEGMWCAYNVGYSVRDAFGEFEERMAPGVADGLLTTADVRFLVDHNASMLLARTKSGTLTLSDSADGALMRALLDLRDSDAQNLLVRLERGDISQMSCGFIVARDQWNDSMDEREVQRFKDLLDVSAVTYPASPTTSLDVARRMLVDTTVESRARIRRVCIDVRAGKVLSSKNVDRVSSAVAALSELLDDANPTDPDELEEAVGITPPVTDPGEQVRDSSEIPEHRDAASFTEQEQQLRDELIDHLVDRGVGPTIWLEDCGPDWAVFTVFSDMCQSFKISYSMDENGACSFGEYDAVNMVTTWEPAAERSDHLVTEGAASTVSETRSDLRLRVSVGKRQG